jgi:hypothetical protein
MANHDLILLAEEHRGDLPPGFDAMSQELEVLLANGRDIPHLTRGDGGSLNHRIRKAVLQELRGFLCTDDPRYAQVREHGGTITRTSTAGIAAYVAGAVGISAGMATACVAFVALAVLNVGVGTFCRVVDDNAV